jgi:dTMP kinase
MLKRNEASSLVALRELREMEKRRLDEAGAARARAERERREQEQARRRADEERRTREAEQQAIQARLAADVARLHGDLELARAEAARWRDELELARVASPPAGSRSPHRWFGWLGLSAGASMLVGALALTAAMRPPPAPRLTVEAPRVVCPEPQPAARAPEPPVVPPTAPPPVVKPSSRARPPAPTRPPAGKPPAIVCDGRDPLCGLPIGTIDDVGQPRGKGGHRPR